MRKILFQVYLEPEQFDFVVKEAERTHRTRTSIVREALDYYKNQKEEQANEKRA